MSPMSHLHFAALQRLKLTMKFFL